MTLTVLGRSWRCRRRRAAWRGFTFDDLCAQPLAAADYLAIAQEFHTVLIDHIPVLSPDKRNEARRFVLLIDTLYDEGVKLICSAAAPPDALYPGATARMPSAAPPRALPKCRARLSASAGTAFMDWCNDGMCYWACAFVLACIAVLSLRPALAEAVRCRAMWRASRSRSRTKPIPTPISATPWKWPRNRWRKSRKSRSATSRTICSRRSLCHPRRGRGNARAPHRRGGAALL